MKKYIKMNNNDNYLSWGNFTRIVKEYSINKTAAMQVELFLSIFDIEDINNTTVNNYCVGCRSINNEYKQIFINYKNKYKKDKLCLVSNIMNLVSILNGNIYNEDDINVINENELLRSVVLKLYNISKNDSNVIKDFSISLYDLISQGDYYNALVNMLFYIVLDNIQPLYEDSIKKSVIEGIFNSTNISVGDLEDYLKLKFDEGINYYHSLTKMADNGNAYACYELGLAEYRGQIKDIARYDVSYKYFLFAASCGYPNAYYMMAQLLLKGFVGNMTHDDTLKAYEYLNKAIEMGNLSAYNSLGVMYLNGIYPAEKNRNLAKDYFNKSAMGKYAFAYNNLGKLLVEDEDYKGALEYFKLSALKGESWACNKVGEYYRLGIGCDKDMDEAYYYYVKATLGEDKYTCYYAYYNLAKYFYLHGSSTPLINKDFEKATKYFKIASSKGIFLAKIELLYLYVNDYLTSLKEDKYRQILDLVKEIEISKEFNKSYKEIIEKEVKKIKEKITLDIDCIKDTI